MAVDVWWQPLGCAPLGAPLGLCQPLSALTVAQRGTLGLQ